MIRVVVALLFVGAVGLLPLIPVESQAATPFRRIERFLKKRVFSQSRQQTPSPPERTRRKDYQDAAITPPPSITTYPADPGNAFHPEWGFFNLFHHPDYAKATPGVKWTRFTSLSWRLFEKQAPREGKHTYDWRRIDEKVRRMQDFPIQVIFVIHPTNEWANSDSCLKTRKRKGTNCPPLPQYMQDWKVFVRNLIERYDHDGFADMPGLKRPFLYWQIGNEYLAPAWWNGTADEYAEVLKNAYEAKLEAHPNAKIILGGLTMSDIFFKYEQSPELFTRKQSNRYKYFYEFSKSILKAYPYFDWVDLHLHKNTAVDFRAVEHANDWLRKMMQSYSYEKPIVSLEWCGAFGREGERQFEKKQAEDFARMFVTLLGNGFRVLIHTQFQDYPSNWDSPSWNQQGIYFADKRTHRITGPKPSFYTYSLLNAKLNGIDGYRRISLGPKDYFYEFSREGRKFYVAWTESTPREADLSAWIPALRVTVQPLVVLEANVTPSSTSAESRRIPLNTIPMLIE